MAKMFTSDYYNSGKSFKEYPGPVKRQDAFNLDMSGMFTSEAAAQAYANTDPAAYVGQILTVVSGNTVKYFGIGNATSDDVEVATLVPIITPDEMQAAVGRVLKYCGSISITFAPNAADPTIMHQFLDNFIAATTAAYATAGSVYNLHVADTPGDYTIHLIDDVRVITPADTAGTDMNLMQLYPQSDGSCWLGIQTIHTLLDAMPPTVTGCLNFVYFTLNSVRYYVFYDVYGYGYPQVEGLPVETYNDGLVLLHLVDQPENTDLYTRGWIAEKIDGVSTVLLSAADATTLIRNNASSITDMFVRYVVAARDGDNIVYNGAYWDVLAGTVDLSGYATKEELASVSGDATNLTRITRIT